MTWDEALRSDGVAVMVEARTGHWIIVAAGQPPVSACPHCWQRLATMTAAKRVADVVFPEPPDGSIGR